MFQETKLKGDDAKQFDKAWPYWEGYFVEAEGTLGGLGIMWTSQMIKGEINFGWQSKSMPLLL